MDRKRYMAQLITLVKEEAANIKLHATKKEKSQLNKRTIDGSITTRCVYGQMTGSCNSFRALELISLCCTRVYVSDGMSIMNKLNGHPHDIHVPADKTRHSVYVSPIENMIFTENGGYNAAVQIVNYIKGDSEELLLG